MSSESSRIPALWHEPAPDHFDLRLKWYLKLLAFAVAAILAAVFLDAPVAAWARAHPIPDLMQRKADGSSWGDAGRELMFLEQYGQFTCSVVAMAAVAMLDPKGRRRALSIAIACLLTLAITHLTKDLAGRSRPFAAPKDVPNFEQGVSLWRGPWQTSSRWGSFPSAHTTAAFALASSLAWFYPRGRGLFMTLATIVGIQRIFHTAHYLSDVISGIAIGVLVARFSLENKIAGRLIALLPKNAQAWWLKDA